MCKRLNISTKMLTGLIFLILMAVSYAQVPDIPGEFLDRSRRLEGDKIRFCIAKNALTVDFDRAVATELAQALLLESEFYEVDPFKATAPLDYHLPLTPEEIYVLLSDKCDAFMSFRMASGYPDWMVLTRPYYQTSFVLAVTDAKFTSLNDIPHDNKIGTWLLTEADLKFTVYLQSLSEGQRWSRAPYPDNQILLERLVDGTVKAALVWEPALQVFIKNHPDSNIQAISTNPFNAPGTDFGIALLAQDPFLRNTLDDAIVALIEDGIIDKLLNDYGLPGKSGELGR